MTSPPSATRPPGTLNEGNQMAFARHCFALRSSDALSRSPIFRVSQGARLLT